MKINTSKRFLLCTLLMSLNVFTGAFAQTEGEKAAPVGESSNHFQIEFSLGVTGCKLKELKREYKMVVNSYRAYGIPIKVQRNYPVNFIAGGQILYKGTTNNKLGLAAEYAKTQAVSLYGDPYGSIDITSAITITTISGVFERNLLMRKMSSYEMMVSAGIRAGIVSGTFNLIQRINLDSEYGTDHTVIEIRGKGVGFSLLPSIGFTFNKNKFFLNSRLGYRWGIIPGMDGSLRVDGIQRGEGELLDKNEDPLEFNLTGIMMNVGIGFYLK